MLTQQFAIRSITE